VRKVVAAAKPAASAFEKGKLSEAKSLAEALKGSDDREAAADAEYVLTRVNDMVGFWKRTVDNATAEGRFDNVFDALGKIQKHYPGTEDATAAAAKEKELKADPAVAAELDAWKKLDKLVEDAQRAKGDEKKLKGVVRKLEKFLETNGSMKAAKQAEQLLRALKK
jgi:hypothetical protein